MYRHEYRSKPSALADQRCEIVRAVLDQSLDGQLMDLAQHFAPSCCTCSEQVEAFDGSAERVSVSRVQPLG